MKEVNPAFKDAKLCVGTKVDFLVVKEPDSSGDTTRETNGKATDVRVL